MQFLDEVVQEAEPPRKKLATAANQHDKDLLLLAKGVMQACQNARISLGITTSAGHIKTSSSVITSMKQAGAKYHTLTKGKKGHTQGIPAWWHWAALIRAASNIDVSGAEAPVLEAATNLKTYMATVNSIWDLKGKVLHCARKTCKEKDTEGEEIDIIEVAVVEELKPMRDAAIAICEWKYKFKQLWGAAPPSGLEKEIQKMINRLGGKSTA